MTMYVGAYMVTGWIAIILSITLLLYLHRGVMSSALFCRYEVSSIQPPFLSNNRTENRRFYEQEL